MEPTPKPRYIVAQTGARRGYAVPAILEEAGMLEHFYTDVCGNVGWGRWLASLSHSKNASESLQKLAHRRVSPGVAGKTTTFPFQEWLYRLKLARRGLSAEDRFREGVAHAKRMGRSICRRHWGTATHLYVMFTEFPTLTECAHEAGLTVVSEIYTQISTERILEAERRMFPDWEDPQPDYRPLRVELGMDRILENHVDHYLCPSEVCASDLIAQTGVAADKVHVVPYGFRSSWLELKPKPEFGRILFVGGARLGKGLHYLAMAANELHRRGRRYEFRVAGQVTDKVRTHSLSKHLTFLGRVPRSLIHEEFQAADVFTLPSLAEGSAEVTYEALGAGVPLVTTRATGSVARDELDGLLVPERDPVALANALERIVEDRALRERMSHSARERARDYTWDKYGPRLAEKLAALR